MSGYDFFSGFLGSLGQQMQDEQNRKRDLEDEDRLYQRKLSFEEAIAASKERQAIAAQERADKRARLNTPPQVRQFKDPETGAWMQEEAEYYGGKWHSRSKATPVLPSVAERVTEDGWNIDVMTNGERVKRGRTDKYLDIQAKNQRSANSVAGRRAIQEARIQADREIAGLRPAVTPVGFAATVRDMYSSYAEKGERGKATMAAGAGVDPKLTPAQRDAAMMEIAKTKAISLLTPKAPDVMFRGSPAATANEAEPEVTDAELEQEPDFMEFSENVILNAEAQKRPINQAEILAKYREFYKQKVK